MKLLWLIALASAMPLAAAPLAVASPDSGSEVAFLEALIDRGEFDLARDLASRQLVGAPAAVKTYLEFVVLRMEAEAALAEADEATFLARLSSAAGKLDELAKREPEAPFSLESLAARAELDLRRGQYFSGKAGEQTNPRERERLARLAVEALTKAHETYLAAATILDAQRTALAANTGAAGKRQAQRALDAYAGCLLGRGWALFELGRVPGATDQDSGRRVQQAVLVLDKLANLKENVPQAARGLALMGYCYQGVDSRRADEAYQRVMRDRRPEAAAGQRDVRYFKLQALAQAVQGGRKPERERYIAEAGAWLADYADRNRTPEALEVRFQLASALLDEVTERPEAERSAPENRAKLEQAAAQFAGVVSAWSPKRRAADERLLAVELLAAADNLPPLAELKSFNDLKRRLRLDLLRLTRLGELLREKAEPAAKDKLLAQQELLLKELAAGLAKANEQLPAQQSPENVARWLQLCFEANVRLGNLADAAAVGEQLLSAPGAGDLAGPAAEQTMRIYLHQRSRGDQAAEARFAALAERTIAVLPQSAAADLAREILGQLRFREQKYAEAASLLEMVSARSPRHAACGFDAGLAWWGVHAQQMRELKQPVGAVSDARLKAFAAMERALPELERSVEPDIVRLAFNDRYVLADLYLRAGDVERALATLAPLVERVEKKTLGNDVPGDAAAQILSLALRAEVLKDPTSPGALARLQALQKLGANGELGGVAERLQELGKQLRAQIIQVEKEGPPAAERLRVLKERFRQFLDQVDKLPRQPAELRSWLAAQYSALGDHAKAAAIHAAVPKPAGDAGAHEQQSYRVARLQTVAELRAAAVAETNPAVQPQRLAALEQVLNEVMREDWAARHPAFLKEKVLLTQLRGTYGGPGGAIEQWDQLRQALEPYVGRSAMYREVYQETQFNLVWCLAMDAKTTPDPGAKARSLTRAAQLVVLLKRGDYGGQEQKARFEALLAQPDMAELRAEVGRLSQER